MTSREVAVRFAHLLPVVVTLAATALAPAPAVATSDPIQPGDYVLIGLNNCTAGFVYDGVGVNADKVYLGTAAHCATSGLGADVVTAGNEVIGDVAFIGDRTANTLDFAFIEVRPAYVSRVSAAVKGHPAYPTGYTVAAQTAAGDPVQLSGHGTLFGATEPTQERRVGLLGFDTATQYGVVAPLLHGDSGGPLVHVPTGRALGIVSRLCTTEGDVCTARGPTVESIVRLANTVYNFPVQLRTV